MATAFKTTVARIDPGLDPGGSAPLIITRDLTKHYGSGVVAVDRLNLAINRGEVYGFLGPNGAGKTTTLRMLLGLIRPTSGTAGVLGAMPGAPAALARIGALVESPAFYPYLSGQDNLRVLARYAGASDARVGAVLAQVSLAARARDKFSTYSLGMKQRLGVAAALLKNPVLLILDEPTNGLDPQGLSEMRELLRTLGRGGQTVLFSSHQLGEVEQICDRVGVLRRGQLVMEGSVADLRGGQGLLVEAEPVAQAQQVLGQLAEISEVRLIDGAFRLTTDPRNAAAINRRLVAAGLAVSQLRPVARSLEEAFLQLTEGEDI